MRRTGERERHVAKTIPKLPANDGQTDDLRPNAQLSRAAKAHEGAER